MVIGVIATGLIGVNAYALEDTIRPVITLIGNELIVIYVGQTYIDAGAICTDDVDGDIIPIVGRLGDSGLREGTYVITYDCYDVAGNAAYNNARVVEVVSRHNPFSNNNDQKDNTPRDNTPRDNTAPVITRIGTGLTTVTIGTVYTDEGATCLDNVDGDITPTVRFTTSKNSGYQTISSIDTSVVSTSLEIYAAQSVQYSCTDAAGNTTPWNDYRYIQIIAAEN